MSSDARSEIIKAIAATTDQNLKTVLLLLLGVLEELGGKIDAMRADEVGLKEAVLNGHSDRHNKHHDWIEERMGSNCDEGCMWAARKMKEEAERDRTAVEDAKADKRSARDAIIRTVVASLTSAAITGLGVLAYLK
jgi:hypothetical protein